MGTLKTTLKVESTDLFPAPVSFTTVNNNAIGANLSAFTTISVNAATTMATLPAANAFLYVASPSTNTDGITIAVGAGGTIFATIQPGDVGFFPLGDGAGFLLEADVLSGTQVLNYYVGTR